jgi:alcohol-forming fatty acyl-CoA reductase
MAERAVVELHGDLPLSIVRPSIIESALQDPVPGWLEGFRMAEPIILAFARGVLTDFSGLPDAPLDVIPVDYVVNTVLAVAASPPAEGEDHRIYHAASGGRNPLRLRRLYDLAGTYFTAHPLRDRYGQAIGSPTWTFPTRQELAGRGRLALRVIEALQQAVEVVPLGPRAARWSDELHDRRTTLERSLSLLDLYAIYTDVDAIFDPAHVLELWETVPAEEQALFPFDTARFDWADYLERVHFPTVIRMARADTMARRGAAPRGSTVPRASGPAATTCWRSSTSTARWSRRMWSSTTSGCASATSRRATGRGFSPAWLAGRRAGWRWSATRGPSSSDRSIASTRGSTRRRCGTWAGRRWSR